MLAAVDQVSHGADTVLHAEVDAGARSGHTVVVDRRVEAPPGGGDI